MSAVLKSKFNIGTRTPMCPSKGAWPIFAACEQGPSRPFPKS